ELKDGCLSLSPIDAGKPGHPGVIIGTKTGHLLWMSDAPATAKPLGPAYADAKLGAPTACLVADFDDDGIPDLIQIFEKGSLIYKGTASGQFADPAPSEISTGPGAGGAFIGDFDMDGSLDIFTVSENGSSGLWNNRGKMQFVNTMN